MGVEAAEAVRIMTAAEKDTRRSKDDPDHPVVHIERFLAKYENILHPYNYVLASMKMKLGCLYGNCPEYLMPTMTKTVQMRKLQLCQESLTPLAILDKGQVGENK